MASVELSQIAKRFGDTTVLTDITLAVADGEFVVLLGPSGCGKSTILRLIAGLDDVTSGRVRIGDRDMSGVKPNDRDVAMVFQNYALYPGMSVRANIEFPLVCRRVPRRERGSMVLDVAAALEVDHLLDRRPDQLSGGQRQRVALARSIVRRPSVFLMDEPLSNLDAELRSRTRERIVDLHRRTGTTVIYVTHDQVEAMTMADRIAVIDGGRIQQIGAPQEVYDEPGSTFVAEFIGSPPMNCVPAGAVGLRPGGVVAGFRPEHVRRAAGGLITATVDGVEMLGADVLLLCRLVDGSPFVIREAFGPSTPVAGTTIHVVVDTHEIRLFDPATGDRITT